MTEGLAWYVVHTNAGQEALAHRELLRQGYDSLWLHYAGIVRHAGKETPVLRSYYPRYLFVGLEPGQGLYGVNKTRGVSTVLYFGEEPVQVPAGVIAQQRAKGDATGLVPEEQVPDRRRGFRPGQRVRIETGPFAGFLADIDVDDGRELRLWVDVLMSRVRVRTSTVSVVAV